MAKARSASEFFASLAKSHLLSERQTADLHRELEGASSGPARDVAARLVERNLLTAWQAQVLLAGHTAFYLGKYKLLDELGRGGMGTVYRAEHTTLKRIVGLKVMARDVLRYEGAVARFQREIQAAAALDDPHIVAAFDAESVGDTHFLVMEYVPGQTLEQLVKGKQSLSIAEACNLIAQAAQGLQHAHERGMAHRDIKPANLLVTRGPDGENLLKILDMGLARFASETRDEGDLTKTGQIMGTPDYIAPEQARNTRSADIRSDIFSLGCTLFRLLTGTVPYRGDNIMEKLMARALQDAPRVRTLRSEIPADLDDVIAKMLARNPQDRYQTPAEVAQALVPYASRSAGAAQHGLRQVSNSPPAVKSRPSRLEDAAQFDPGLDDFLKQLATEAAVDVAVAADESDTASIQHGLTRAAIAGSAPAKPPQRQGKIHAGIERRSRQTRQQGVVIGLVAVAVILLIAGAYSWSRSSQTWLIVDLPEDERQAETIEIDGVERPLPKSGEVKFGGRSGRRSLKLTRQGYEPVSEERTFARGESHVFKPEWIPTSATQRRGKWDTLRARGEEFLAGGISTENLPALRQDLLAFQRQKFGTDDARACSELLRRLPAPADGLHRDRIPEYELLAAGEGAPDSAPAEIVAILGDSRLKHWGPIHYLTCTHDGGLASGGYDGAIRVWDAASGRLRRSLAGADGLFAVAADGSVAVARNREQSLTLWNLATGDSQALDSGGDGSRPLALAVSGDSRLLAAGLANGEVVVWSLPDQTIVARFRSGAHRVHRLAFNPAGELLAGCGDDFKVRVWSARSGVQRHEFASDGRKLCDLAFHPGGRLLACGMWIPKDGRGTVRVWDVSEGREVTTFPEMGAVSAIAFSPDGSLLATGTDNWDESGFAGCWEVEGWRKVWEKRIAGEVAVRSLAFSPDSRTLAIGGDACRIYRWTAATGEPLTDLEQHHTASVSSVAVSADGSTIVSGSLDTTALVWDLAANQPKTTLAGHDLEVYAVGISLDGETIATAGRDGRVILWDADDGALRRRMTGHIYRVGSLAFSPDGRQLATGGWDNLAIVWDVAKGLESRRFTEDLSVSSVAFSPDGTTLATAGRGASQTYLRIWDLTSDSKKPKKTWKGFADGILSVDFSPDGEKLVACGNPVRQVNLKQRTEQVLDDRHATSLRYSPDGRWMVGYLDGGLRVWSSATRAEELAIPMGYVRDARFTPEGRHVVTANANGTLYVIRLPN